MQIKNRPAVLSLAMIMAFRILGLFMILPVFSAHAVTITGATPTLIGIALGIYGLTQALLQTPFGLLSDRIGRKPIIAIGLSLFAGGSIICALSSNMTELILGRAIQGTGAIGSTALAYIADLTRDENRSKAMAFIGLSIGIAFSIAMVVGPVLFAWANLSGIFWVTAAFAGIGLLLLIRLPKPPEVITHDTVEVEPNRLRAVFKNKQLLRLDFGIFSLHFVLTALFIVIPILFTHIFHLSTLAQSGTYLIVLFLSFIFMLPFIIIAEKKRRMKPIFISAIGLLLCTQVALYFYSNHSVLISIILLCFFTAFNLLEASLPSLVSKFAPIRFKGTAMGVYSTSQYLGICLGGAIGGIVLAKFGIHGIFFLCSLAALLWLLAALTMKQPPYLSTLIFEAKSKGREINQKLNNFPGVAEVSYSTEENLIYTKVDKRQIDENELRKCIEEVTLTEAEILGG